MNRTIKCMLAALIATVVSMACAVTVRGSHLQSEDFFAAPVITTVNASSKVFLNVEYDLARFLSVSGGDSNVTLSFQQNGSPVENYRSYCFKQEGGFVFTVTAQDGNGNRSESVVLSLTAATESAFPATLRTEIVRGESYFYSPTLPSSQDSYTVSLYSAQDTAMQHPLAENVLSYRFTERGDYRLKYRIYYFGATGLKEHVARLIVEDTTKPVITLHREYEKRYAQAGVLNLIPADVADNCDSSLTYSISLRCGAEPVLITDNQAVLRRAGNYTVAYTSVDASGNEDTLQRSFLVCDFTPPSFAFNGKYKKEYRAGTTLKLLVPTVADEVDGDVNYQVFVTFNGMEIAVKNNKVSLKGTGKYSITYRAADAAGNSVEKSFKITVTEGGTDTTTVVLVVCISAFGVGGVALAAVLLIKRYSAKKKKETEGKDDDENEKN